MEFFKKIRGVLYLESRLIEANAALAKPPVLSDTKRGCRFSIACDNSNFTINQFQVHKNMVKLVIFQIFDPDLEISYACKQKHFDHPA